MWLAMVTIASQQKGIREVQTCHGQVVSPGAVLELRAKVDAFLSAKDLYHRGRGFLVLTCAQPACTIDRVEPETAAQDSEPNAANTTPANSTPPSGEPPLVVMTASQGSGRGRTPGPGSGGQ
jgi:hypothetical protein